ncbi:MAG TPA: ABC transporter ATP-binding protein, partial [Pseudorhizobium sp.]|nr:ABC transporter ATP-binding protein [Pseudorhizobium sp.]
EVAHHGPEDLFLAVMTLIGAFALMMWVHMPLATITTIIVPLTAIVTTFYGQRMTNTWHALYGRVADFNTRIEANVGGIRVVQAFANEDHERRLFAEDNSNYRTTKLQAYKVMAAATSLSYFSMRFVQVVVMLAGAWFVTTGSLSAGGFVGFLLLVNVFFRPIEKINAVIETYPKGIAGFQRYTQFLATEPDIADCPGAAPLLRPLGEIRYCGVGFGYRNGRKVLDAIDFRIEAGETVAFVGPSGAGKTTICSLLPRFYEVSEGSITIDGTDIRDVTLKSLRESIGIVQQDVFLFAGTIRQNILYGRLDASDEEVRQAARRARLDAMIADLPDGYDTVIGERGVKLSGGQKQRLAIARIFLKNPPILILDEATSALDTETERAIQASLAELSEGRTTLVIAHRLTTITKANRIFVVDGGRIVEKGSHEMLVSNQNSAFYRLAKTTS